MKRWFAALAAVALLAAACGDDGGGDEGTAAAPPVGDPTAPADPPSGTEAPAAGGSIADLAITEVVFGDHATITNLGDATVSIDELWVCNRPSYTPLAVNLAPGEEAFVEAGSLGGLTAGSGEVALYTSNSFGDPGAIVDYVNWGGGGGRTSVAADAGIWPDGDTVEAGGASIVALNGGASSADWSSQ